MGVNLGSLGFLTEVPRPGNDADFGRPPRGGGGGLINPRMMVEAVFKGESSLCLNDIVINKGALARIIQMKIRHRRPGDRDPQVGRADHRHADRLDGLFAGRGRADSPAVHARRPAHAHLPAHAVVPADRRFVRSRIRLELLTAGEEVYLTFDGQRGSPMMTGDVVEVRRSKHELKARLVAKTGLFRPAQRKVFVGGMSVAQRCHREERSDVAIANEIATAKRPRNDTIGRTQGPPVV